MEQHTTCLMEQSQLHHSHVTPDTSTFKLSIQATMHCLTGCAIGELAGLVIGVSLGLNPWTTMALATFLGFVSGYTLGLRPLVKRNRSNKAVIFKLIKSDKVSPRHHSEETHRESYEIQNPNQKYI